MSQESFYRDQAASLLVTHPAFAGIDRLDAQVIVGFMQPLRMAVGSVLMEEGQPGQTDFMLLVLEGEVSVKTYAVASDQSINMSSLGPGSLIGEMGVLDGAPRSATCVAVTELVVARLARQDLLALVRKDPQVGASLLLAIAVSLSGRLRAANRQIKTLSGISRALQQELEVAHDSQFAGMAEAQPVHQLSTFKDRSSGDWSESGVRLHGFAKTQPPPRVGR